MPLITILGPTASGKTTLAAHLAARLGDAEIISADSRQVYRGMDIGTGKDLADYKVDGRCIPYHLIDICEAGEKYNLFRFQEDFHTAYDDILRRHRRPILCGGTGLYIESVLKGYKMETVPENPALREELKDLSLPELKTILEGYKTLHNVTDLDTTKRAIRAIEIQAYYREHGTLERDFPGLEALTATCAAGASVSGCVTAWNRRTWWARFAVSWSMSLPRTLFIMVSSTST